jgi:hypothetical protein
MPEISEKSLQVLKSYLEAHSEDIAISENDFGDLQEVYQELCGRNKEPGWIQKCDEICNQQHIKIFSKDTHMFGY